MSFAGHSHCLGINDVQKIGSQWNSAQMNNRHPWQLKKKIMGAVLELPAKQHCQSSPFIVKMANWAELEVQFSWFLISYPCNTEVHDIWSLCTRDWSLQKVASHQYTWVLSMSFYSDFISILDFIQILFKFYPDFILILSRFSRNSLYLDFWKKW